MPYLDLTEAYHEALELSANALNDAQSFISEKVKTNEQEGIPLLVFNPLNWERDDILKTTINFESPVTGFKIIDETGEKLAFETESKKQEGIKTTKEDADTNNDKVVKEKTVKKNNDE